jgi:hypothetical protein
MGPGFLAKGTAGMAEHQLQRSVRRSVEEYFAHSGYQLEDPERHQKEMVRERDGKEGHQYFFTRGQGSEKESCHVVIPTSKLRDETPMIKVKEVLAETLQSTPSPASHQKHQSSSMHLATRINAKVCCQ